MTSLSLWPSVTFNTHQDSTEQGPGRHSSPAGELQPTRPQALIMPLRVAAQPVDIPTDGLANQRRQAREVPRAAMHGGDRGAAGRSHPTAVSAAVTSHRDSGRLKGAAARACQPQVTKPPGHQTYSQLPLTDTNDRQCCRPRRSPGADQKR